MPGTSPSKIRTLVVDDHGMARFGVAAMLSTTTDIELIGEATNGLQAVTLAAELKPAVILMDLLMPAMDGAEATKKILAMAPETRIIVMTGSEVESEIFEAIEAGACGFVPKTASLDELVAAVRQVAQGLTWLPSELTRRFWANLNARPALPEPLTPRENEVLRLVARGYSNSEIAAELGVANITVRTHVSRILGKLGVKSRVAAALYARRTAD